MIRTAAHDARAVPTEIAAFGYRVGLFVDLRIAVGRPEKAEVLAAGVGLTFGAGPAMIVIRWSLVFLEILSGMEHWPRFQKCHVDAQIGQYVRNCSAACAGTDHDNVRHRCAPLHLKHVLHVYHNLYPMVLETEKKLTAAYSPGRCRRNRE